MTALSRRFMYFGYYLRRMNWPLLGRFMAHVQAKSGASKGSQWRAILHDSLRFNISPLEYYQFRFFELEDAEKAAWAGTGTMYEFQRQANPPFARTLLLDKRLFYKAYKPYFRHEMHTRQALRTESGLLKRLLSDNRKLVFKDATGNCGAGVIVRNADEFSDDDVLEYMRQNQFDIVETFVEQHPVMQSLSPSGVNTVRVFTQIREDGEYEVLGCRLRISVDSPVDNLAAGNLVAPIDMDTGIVNGPGVYADITKRAETGHPVTGTPIVEFQVPFWQDTLNLVREASLLHPENRSVGWDIAITDQGPGLIEGNHDWCKLVWQLPVKRGLKHLLDPYYLGPGDKSAWGEMNTKGQARH